MTRFARAKGSKASNERVAEEATPWSQMKQQLLDKNKDIADSKNRQEAINKRHANYKAFLKEKEKEESKKSHWAEFPDENTQKKSVSVKRIKKNSFSAAADKQEKLSDIDESFVAQIAKADKVLSQPEHTNRSNEENDDSDAPPEEHSSKIQVSNQPPKVKKVKKKKVPIPKENNNFTNETSDGMPENNKKKRKREEQSPEKKKKLKTKTNAILEGGDVTSKGKLKNQKGTNQPKKIIMENLTEQELKKIEKKKQKRIKQLEKKKKVKAESKKQKIEEKRKIENGEVAGTSENAENNELNKDNNRKFDVKATVKDFKGKFEKPNKLNDKKPKPKAGKEHQRRKPLLPTKMFINGKEVEVDYVDGFPVKKEDAARLKKLRREMISKGLPRSEINIALKLERRRAEKAFSREKKKVCFNCRKSGHNLSECPELGKDQISPSGSGICFKCGSTEHTHFECKVVKGQEFKYAQCFVCNEQGHIARQCPDNARGLYPKGGSCKVCGDVTHLKRDCPKYQAQQLQLQNNLSIETIGNSNPDVLDGSHNNSNFGLGNKRPNKIVKF